jgi:hypothetical protein
MATIHERRLRSGEIVWELTHGTGSDRQRFVAGKTREEAQEILNQFNRQLALHGQAPSSDSIETVIADYGRFLTTNRRPNTVNRYQRVLRTFHQCYLLPFAPEVMLHELLVVQHAHRRNDRFVFPNESGNRDTHILDRLKKICVRAGIRPHTVHALRHSFGAHLRMAGVSLADIGDLLGHQDLATTQIYAKVHQEHLRKAVAKLAPLVPTTPGERPSRLLPDSTPSSEDEGS